MRKNTGRFLSVSIASFIITLWVFCIPVSAATLTYNEAVDGDIVNESTLPSLDFGTNTVSGVVSCCSGVDFDKFYTYLPAFGVLDSLQLAVSNGTGGTGAFASFLTLNLDGAPNDKHFSGAGVYNYPLGFAGSEIYVGLNGFKGGMVNGYTLTFNVSRISTIPLPASLPLYGAGLIIMSLFARRRRRMDHLKI